MVPNPGKSGVMFFGGNAPDRMDLHGYPVVRTYKHLGCTINNSLNTSDHLDTIQKKINFIRNRLTPVRTRAGARLNSNLFRVMVLPLYRLAFCQY